MNIFGVALGTLFASYISLFIFTFYTYYFILKKFKIIPKFEKIIIKSRLIKLFSLLGGAIAMGFGAIGPGIGDGIFAKNANIAVVNSPRQMGLLTRTMIIGQAITETTDIYSLVVALILIFVV